MKHTMFHKNTPQTKPWKLVIAKGKQSFTQLSFL